MRHSLYLLLSLAIFWILLSGFFEPFLLAMGLLSCTLAVFIANRMDVIDHEGYPVHLTWLGIVPYWLWLTLQIVRSALEVSKCILSPSLPISPTFRKFIPGQEKDIFLVIHANSITLTPGTFCVEVQPKHMLVHCLTRDSADGLEDSEMDRRCTALEKTSA